MQLSQHFGLMKRILRNICQIKREIAHLLARERKQYRRGWKKISTNVEFHRGGVDEDCGHGYEVQAQHFQSS
jgi:hypothetical protein